MLKNIIERRRRLAKKISRQILATRFYRKTGRRISNLQRISDIRKVLGISWQKTTNRSSRAVWLSARERAQAFVTREHRNSSRKCKWFVDQIKLPDASVVQKSYGKRGEAPVVESTGSSGTGTGIMSCNSVAGMGPFMYVRNGGKDKGTKRWHMLKYFRKKLLPAMKPGDILYLDNAKINCDKKYRSIERIFGPAQIEVRYLPPNSTWLISPLDQQPFACLRALWNAEKDKTAFTAPFVLRRCVAAITKECVEKGIKSAGF